MEEITKNIKVNPFILEPCIWAYIHLVSEINEKDHPTLDSKFINLFKCSLACFEQETREYLYKDICPLLLKVNDYATLCAKQCLETAYNSLLENK